MVGRASTPRRRDFAMATHAASTTPQDVTLLATDGLALKAWAWPSAEGRGALGIAHGLGEHGGCSRGAAEGLRAALGIDVLAFDFRGHGRSPGRRGVVRRYEDLTADLRGALQWAARERPGRPVFILAHSNGGQVALRTL